MDIEKNPVGNDGIRRRVVIQGAAAAGLAAATLPFGTTAFAASPTLEAEIDITKKRDPISKFVYGSFSEHIGTSLYDAVWAEVTYDRKFYYAVDEQPQPARKWRPLGDPQAVTMDTVQPYVGEQSPVVALSRFESRGIWQDGLSLAQKDYVGRVVIAGDPGTHVVVTLSWGDGPGNRQSVGLPVRKDWVTVPLKFRCSAATTNGRLEIAATGTGHFKVGAVSLMPADNVKGFRKDTIELLATIGAGFWRFPGGNYVSGHDWQDAVGDPDRRPTKLDPVRNSPQSNDIGTDEFLTMCQLLGTEPYLCVNSGFGSAREAAQLVEYVNGNANTPMGRLRAANGHREPYGVKYWNIGNEIYGFWQLGYMTPEHYMIKHNLIAEAMKKVDPTIDIAASGATPCTMTIHRLSFYVDPNTRKVVQPTPVIVEYGSATDWDYRMMDSCWGNFNKISNHCYGTTQRFDLDQGMYVNIDPPEPVLDSCRRGANFIHAVNDDWELFKKDFPIERDNIMIALDEWGYRGASGLKRLLALAMMLNEMIRHTDSITMAAYTFGTGWLSYNRTESTYSEVGLLFKLYRHHLGTIPVEISGNSPQPAPTWPAGGDQPKVTSGSPTYPLDMVAALTEDGKTLTVAVVNATADPQPINLRLSGFTAASQGRLWRLTGPNLSAANRVGQPPQVTVEETNFDVREGNVSVAPYSIELRAFTRS